MPAIASNNPEFILANDIAGFYADPLSFVRYAFNWGEGDLTEHSGPDTWQVRVLRAIGQGVLSVEEALRVAVASGHGVGKTALVAWIILWAMSTRPHLAGVVTANTKNQLNEKTWRELSLWHKRAINSHWFALTATKFYQVDYPDTWFMAAVPWSAARPEAFAGLHAEHVLVIYDEASAIDDIIWETSEGAMTTKGAMWICFGNPTRNTGRFRECFAKYRHRWITQQVDSRNARMANAAQIRQWADDYGEDSDFFRVRVRGEFPNAASNQFIAMDLVENAANKKLPLDAHQHAARVLGVDVARFGDDESVIQRRQGLVAFTPRRFRGLDTMTLAGLVAEEINDYKPQKVFIDQGGVGGGVVDKLGELGYTVTGVDFGGRALDARKYANKRAEMWGLMRDWLAAGAAIPDDRQLKDELIGPEYFFTPQHQIILEKKEDMKKRGLASPDSADALALTFAFPVAAPVPFDARFAQTTHAQDGDYNPLEY